MAKQFTDILANLVNSMRVFLQTSPTKINENVAGRDLFFQGINPFHLPHLRASEVKEPIRSDTSAERHT